MSSILSQAQALVSKLKTDQNLLKYLEYLTPVKLALITLLAAFPVIVLLRLLPVPLIAPVPVSLKFSRLLPSVKLIEEWTASVPELLASIIVSLVPSIT